MKLLTFLLFTLYIAKLLAGVRHLPEERNYVSNTDIGYTQYGTPSLYKTNKYSLTFDDGPHSEYTEQILDILKARKVRATFFVVTERITTKTLPIVLRALKEGHTIGSHHHSHDHNNRVDKKTFKSKLKKSILKILEVYKIAKVPLTHLYYRFPFAEYGKTKKYHHMNIIREVSYELFNNNCIRFVFWDHDSSDWMDALNSNDVFNNLLSFQNGGEFLTYKVDRSGPRTRIVKKVIPFYKNTEGGVILQHDIQKKTIEATRRFLEYSKTNYLDIVPLNETDEYRTFSKSCKSAFLK